VAAVVANPVPLADGEDWQLIPDAEGNMHMVDLNSYVDTEPAFNGWTDIIFTVFTRFGPAQGTRVDLNNAAQLAASGFNGAHPTRYTIHGWNGGPTSSVNTLNRAAFFGVGDFNMVQVDWSAGAVTINYLAARNRVQEAGTVVGNHMDFVNLHTNAAFSAMSAIGHSLGAHVAGFAGRAVSRGVLQTITALDPALPLFSIGNAATRLHSSDAVHVESIHTDAGRLGFDDPIGDASFYPNFGRSQPGCGIDLAGTCAHERANPFFAESVSNPNAFWGTRCSGHAAILASNCPSVGASTPMGGPTLTHASGVFFMPTNAGSPFGQGFRP